MPGLMRFGYVAAWLAMSGAGILTCQAAPGGVIAENLRAPPGFEITHYASGIPGVRMLHFTASGALIASVPGRGRVILLSPGAMGAAPEIHVLLDGLNGPHGVDLHEDLLYVAEEDAVGRIAFNEKTGMVEGGYQRIITGLPEGAGHSTRTVRVGPDEKLYVTVGSSCNACIEVDPRRAAMLRYDLDGGNGVVYAEGLRNPVGFDWRPSDGTLFATDNGRDQLGDDLPPCELNLIEQGGHYGWPYAYGDNVPDPQYGPGAPEIIARAKSPVFEFRAHNAPLGIIFVRNSVAPELLRGAALVALHGSWNRSSKDGYKVVMLNWRADGKIEARDFVWGFLKNGKVSGRPVDIAEGPDGAFYISDDYAGTIYRVAEIAH
ncbi:MAG: PQQ-dependent sugar dehydrogenase [Alphaproteobacteria bacterium]